MRGGVAMGVVPALHLSVQPDSMSSQSKRLGSLPCRVCNVTFNVGFQLSIHETRLSRYQDTQKH